MTFRSSAEDRTWGKNEVLGPWSRFRCGPRGSPFLLASRRSYDNIIIIPCQTVLVPSDPPIPPAVKTDAATIVEQHVLAGCSAFRGTVAGKQATVISTPYSDKRMKQRDVVITEALEILSLPPNCHGAGKQTRRREVVGTVGRRQVRVVYEWVGKEVAKIITVYQE